MKIFRYILVLSTYLGMLASHGMMRTIGTELNKVSSAISSLSNTISGRRISSPSYPPPSSTRPTGSDPLRPQQQPSPFLTGKRITILDPNTLKPWATGNLPDSAPGQQSNDRLVATRDTFSYVLGMNETEFRNNIIHWNIVSDPTSPYNGKLTADLNNLTANWITAYENPRGSGNFPRAALLTKKIDSSYSQEREHYFTTLGNENSKFKASSKQGTFTILYRDLDKEAATDIRALQIDPANKGAAFQVASTFFGPLEGHMIPYESKLEDMATAAVQGELLSMGAAGDTLKTKYLEPLSLNQKPEWPRVGQSIYRAPYFNQYYYLLQNTGRFTLKGRQKGVITGVPVHIYCKPSQPNNPTSNCSPELDVNFITQNNPDAKWDPNRVGIFVKKNAIITWGRSGSALDQDVYLPVIYNKTTDTINSQHTQFVHQIFGSAINFGSKAFQSVKNAPNDKSFAWGAVVLEGVYQATITAAANIGAKKLYLTMIGGGAFNNQMEWIASAILKCEKLIQQSGLDVYLIYRDDYRRPPAKPRAFFERTPQMDYNFILTMQALQNRINKTSYTSNFKQVWDYVNKLYGRIVPQGEFAPPMNLYSIISQS